MIDRYPVTNAEFKNFMDATHYHPKDDYNFLRTGQNGTYPDGWDSKPVTWVSLEDARAYAAWAGKRLPHEWEWQYAAQGGDGRPVSLGRQLGRQRWCRSRQRAHHAVGLTTLTAHPRAASPFGVEDLVGNVWQWTDEFSDDHTRGGIVARRQLLSAARVAVVFSAGVPTGSAREVSADGAQQRSRRHAWIPMREGWQ